MARKASTPPKKERTVAVGIRLSEGLLKKLDRVARSRGSRRSPFASMVLEKYLKDVA